MWTPLSSNRGVHLFELNSNKLKLCIAPKRGPGVVTLDVVYRVGSINEKQGLRGSSHLLEHAMFKGSKKYNDKHHNGMWSLVDKCGANLNATTSTERTNYIDTLPVSHLNDALLLEADRLRAPLLEKEGMEKERVVVRNEFERALNNDMQLLRRSLFRTAMENGLHGSTIGTKHDIEGIIDNMDVLRGYFNKWYTPDNATVIVTGSGFDPEEVKRMVAEAFGDIENSHMRTKADELIPELPQLGYREVNETGNSTLLAMGYKSPTGMTREAMALDVLATILNQGTSGPFGSIITKNEAHQVEVEWDRVKDNRFLFTVWASLPHNTRKALDTVQSSVEKVLSAYNISQTQLDTAKKAMRSDWIRSMATTRSYAKELAESVSRCGTPYDCIHRFDVLDSVTLKDLHDLKGSVFVKPRLSVARMLPSPEKSVAPMPNSLYAPAESKPASTIKAYDAERLPLHQAIRKGTNYFLKLEGEPDVHVKMHVPLELVQSTRPHAQLMAAMMTQGATIGGHDLTKESIRDELTANSARLHVFNDFSGIHIDYTFPKENTKRCLEILRGELAKPRFSAEEFQRTKIHMQQEVLSNENDVDAMSGILFTKAIFGGKEDPRCQQSPKEMAASIQNASRQTLKTMLRKQFHDGLAGASVTVVAPTMAHLRAVEEAICTDSEVSPSSFNIKAPPINQQAGRVLFQNMPGKTSTTMRLGYAVPMGERNHQMLPLKIAVNILGGSFSSRLMRSVRVEHGYSYGIYSTLSALDPDCCSIFQVKGTFAPSILEAGIQLTKELVERWRNDGITKEELQTCKNRMIGGKLVSLESSSALSGALHSANVMHGPEAVGKLMSYEDRVSAVSLEECNDAIHSLPPFEDMICACAGTLNKDQIPLDFSVYY